MLRYVCDVTMLSINQLRNYVLYHKIPSVLYTVIALPIVNKWGVASICLTAQLTETQSEGKCDGRKSYLVKYKCSQRASLVQDSLDAIYWTVPTAVL